MKYLKLETCQLLEKLECASESGKAWFVRGEYQIFDGTQVKEGEPFVDDDCDQLDFPHKRICTCYVFEDLTIKENLEKIFGEFKLFAAEPQWPKMIESWLYKKIYGQDWEAELLKHLKESK